MQRQLTPTPAATWISHRMVLWTLNLTSHNTEVQTQNAAEIPHILGCLQSLDWTSGLDWWTDNKIILHFYEIHLPVCNEAKNRGKWKGQSHRELNPGHLWLEPPVLCHWVTTAGQWKVKAPKTSICTAQVVLNLSVAQVVLNPSVAHLAATCCQVCMATKCATEAFSTGGSSQRCPGFDSRPSLFSPHNI